MKWWGNANSSELLLLKCLPLTYHHSHFLAATCISQLLFTPVFLHRTTPFSTALWFLNKLIFLGALWDMSLASRNLNTLIQNLKVCWLLTSLTCQPSISFIYFSNFIMNMSLVTSAASYSPLVQIIYIYISILNCSMICCMWYTGFVYAPNCTITPLNPTFLPADGGVIYNGTSHVMIKCNCMNVDYGKVTWHSPNKEEIPLAHAVNKYLPYIIQDNGTLVIPVFNDSFQGTYYCGVGNNSIFSANISITLPGMHSRCHSLDMSMTALPDKYAERNPYSIHLRQSLTAHVSTSMWYNHECTVLFHCAVSSY